MRIVVVIGVLLIAGPAVARTLAVLPVDAPALNAGQSETLDEIAQAELARLAAPPLQVVDAAAVHAARGVEACAGALGCVAAYGARVQADEVIVLALSTDPDGLRVSARLIDVDTASERAQVTQVGAADRAENTLRAALVQLLAPERYAGAVHVQVAGLGTDGAAIRIDGVLRGQTPLLAPIGGLSPGRHAVAVELAGLAPFAAFVDVPFDGVVEVDLTRGDGALVATAAPPAAAVRARPPGPLLLGGVGALLAGGLCTIGGIGAVAVARTTYDQIFSGAGTQAALDANRRAVVAASVLFPVAAAAGIGGGVLVGLSFSE